MASNLPPGVTSSDIAAMSEEGPCEVCGQAVEHCLCEPCPVCNTLGDPDCYESLGMRLRIVQRLGWLDTMIAQTKTQIDEIEYGLSEVSQAPLGGGVLDHLRQKKANLEAQSWRLSDALDNGVVFMTTPA